MPLVLVLYFLVLHLVFSCTNCLVLVLVHMYLLVFTSILYYIQNTREHVLVLCVSKSTNDLLGRRAIRVIVVLSPAKGSDLGFKIK